MFYMYFFSKRNSHIESDAFLFPHYLQVSYAVLLDARDRTSIQQR